ncbi:MAG: AI-2E family transporter, partial [Thermoleophilia bacterium]
MRQKILVPKYVQYILLPLMLLFALWFLSTVLKILIMFLLAAIIAFVLDLPVTLLQKKMRLPRLMGVILVWVLILAVFAGLVALIVPNIISELNSLIENIPEYSNRTQSIVEDFQKWFGELDIPYKPD